MNSKLSAVAEPADAAEPKPLMAAWMQMLEMENTVPCSPVGIPMRSMRRACSRFSESWRRQRRKGSSPAMRKRITMAALTALARTVAMPTPATLRRKTITKMRLRMTLITPETARHHSGRWLSPRLRRMAAPKL